MKGVTILLGTAACLTAAASTDAAPSSTTSQALQAQNERAREKFRLGVNAFRAERLEEARQLLSEAWRLRRTYDVAASLAQVEHELGHDARAAELLDFCLNNFAPIESDTRFQQLQQAFDSVRGRVGQIDLSGLPSDAEVAIDGQPFVALAMASPMYVEPGLHEFAIRVGSKEHHRSLLVQPGTQHRLELGPATASGQVQPPRPTSIRTLPPSAPAPGSAARPTFPYYLGGALFLSGVTTAVVFQVAATQAKRRERELSSQPGASDCGSKTFNPLCSDLAETNADYHFNRNLAIFGYGIAATAALATTIYWLWPEPARAPRLAGLRNASIVFDSGGSQFWVGAMGAL